MIHAIREGVLGTIFAAAGANPLFPLLVPPFRRSRHGCPEPVVFGQDRISPPKGVSGRVEPKTPSASACPPKRALLDLASVLKRPGETRAGLPGQVKKNRAGRQPAGGHTPLRPVRDDRPVGQDPRPFRDSSANGVAWARPGRLQAAGNTGKASLPRAGKRFRPVLALLPGTAQVLKGMGTA